MRKLFRILISVSIVASMVLTTGIDVIQENTSEVETKAKEVLLKEEAPKAETPKEETPKEEAPKVEAPKEEVPKAEAPKEEAPKEEVPKAEAPKEEVPKAEVPEENPPKEEVPKEDPLKEPPLNEEDKVEEDKVDEDETEEEEKEVEEEEIALDPLEITLTDAKTLIENSITLGIGTDPNAENYMSEPTGGDGNYTYEWRVLGEEEVFYEDRYPTIYPKEIPQINPMINTEETIRYHLTLKDGSGLELDKIMTLIVEDPRGSITLTNIVENTFKISFNTEFDIFVSGSDGSLYTVSLADGQSTTLSNLKRADYTISTISPMNHRLLGISNNNINISVENLDHSTKINNIRTNNSWFFSY